MKYLPKTILYIGLLGCFIFLFLYFSNKTVQQAGDISEYYGTTESLKNHLSFELTPYDQTQLKKILHSQYFQDPTYYVANKNGQRFPVHFIFYSLLVFPIRLILELLNINPLLSLTFTNLIITIFSIFIIFRFLVKNTFPQYLLSILLFLSPAVFFLSWPGPDIYYFVLTLIAVFLFSQKKILLSSVLMAFASWHSQPLLITSGLYLLFYFIKSSNIKLNLKKISFHLNWKTVINCFMVVFILIIPYLYNLLAFQVLSPWTIFKDGRTVLYGFGIQNISLKKLYEQFFDFNMGLFWYAPLYVILGFYFLTKIKNGWFLLLTIITTALFYQTNPGWHFGTAGFGPSRHIIFALPFFIFVISTSLKRNCSSLTMIILIVISQLYLLSLNGYIFPDFQNTLKHSPIATFILNHYPQFYNPSPEIFIDRTNHSDVTIPTSAIYKDNHGTCKKAYVLLTDTSFLESQCGQVSSHIASDFDNEYLRQANYPRQIWTNQATFWPDSNSCEDWYKQDPNNQFVCLKNLNDATNAMNINDITRFHPVDNLKGVWRLEIGLPIKITIPPGYIVQHYSFEGTYVNF